METNANEIGIEKFLVTELAQPPFNLDFTVASFGNLDYAELIHLLTLIMAEIDPEQGRVDLAREDEQATLTRVLEFLRVLKYQMPDDNPHVVRERILNGDPDFLVPIMAWLLNRKDDLKVRAYLAKYLVKVPIPDDDWWTDVEIEGTYQKYEDMLEEFKATHKRYLKLQATEGNTATLLGDLQIMEHDIDCIQRKLDGMKFRLNENGQTPAMLKSVHDVRIVGLKNEELIAQERNEERTYAELRKQKLELQNLFLEESNSNNQVSSGKEMLDREIEENNRLRTLVHEKSPYEYDLLRRKIHALQLVEEAPPENEQHLKFLVEKVRETKSQITEAKNRKRVKNSSEELFVLRQKANALQLKKDALHAKLDPVIHRLQAVQSQIEYEVEKRDQKEVTDAQWEEEYLALVQFIQEQGDRCARKQEELAYVRKEVGILSSTKFIVDGQWRESEGELEKLETRLGLSGFYEDPEKVLGFGRFTSPEFEEKKNQLYEMVKNVKRLMAIVKAKKEKVDSLMNDVNEARQHEAMLEMDFTTQKQNFDALCLKVESGNMELQLKTNRMKEQWESNQFKLVQLKCLLAQMNVTRFRVTEETVSQNLSFRGFRDKLKFKILEQERVQKQLETERCELDEFLADSGHQMQLWGNVVKLLEWKRNMPRAAARFQHEHEHIDNVEQERPESEYQYQCYDNSEYVDDDDGEDIMDFFS